MKDIKKSRLNFNLQWKSNKTNEILTEQEKFDTNNRVYRHVFHGK